MSVIEPQNVPHSDHFPSVKASGFGQLPFDPYDLPSNDEEYFTPKSVAETTPRQSDCTARLLTAARLNLNSPPEAPTNWGQVNLNLHDYHSDPTQISRPFLLAAITDWWHQQEEMHPKYADLSTVARDTFSIIPHGVGVEARCSLRRDDIGLIQSTTPCETLQEKLVVRQFAQANKGILVGNCAALDNTENENDLELKKEVKVRTLHRMAKVYNYLEMWQAAKTNVLQRENPALKTCKWLPKGTFQVQKRSSKHHGQTLNMMGQLHLNCQKDHLCYPFVWKGPPWRTNWNIKCPLNQQNRPSSGETWWGVCTWQHFRHRKLA